MEEINEVVVTALGIKRDERLGIRHDESGRQPNHRYNAG